MLQMVFWERKGSMPCHEHVAEEYLIKVDPPIHFGW
jgi:hypothetical protein